MALPSLTKTWQFQVNQSLPALGSLLSDNRALLLAIKNSLKGAGSWTDSTGASTSPLNPFIVRYSCDSVTAGSAGDLVDRWSTSSNLVWATPASAHSWIVLRQTGIASNFEILMSLENAAGNGNLIRFSVSPSAGFTGGTTGACPTATDEINIISANAFTTTNSDITYRLHVMSTTDGQCTRVIVYQSNVVVLTWLFDKPQVPVSGWTNPSLSLAIPNAPTMGNLYSGTASIQGRGTANFTMFFSCEAANNVSIPTDMVAPNDFDSSYPMLPIGIYSKTASHRGRHGTVFDLWFGLVATNDGDAYPASGTTHQFSQIGDLVMPWNQSTMTTA